MGEESKTNGAPAAVVEYKQPPILYRKTQKLLGQIEEALDGPIITYWVGGPGAIYGDDVVILRELLQAVGQQKKLHLYIKSTGGSGQVALRVVQLMRTYCEQLVALVPFECASAATMLALGADEIRMGPLAYLSAVDTSILHALSPTDNQNQRVRVSLDELNRVIRLWTEEQAETGEVNPYQALFEHVHPLVMGAADRTNSLSVKLCQEILSTHVKSSKKAVAIAEALNSNYPSHSYPIILREAQGLGLNAKPLTEEVNSQLMQLHELYSEMGQKACTDFDESHYHDNEIIKVFETRGLQLYFQNDRDQLYNSQQRRWITMNDESGWRRCQQKNGRLKKTRFHLR